MGKACWEGGGLCLGDFFIDESWSQWLPSFSPLERKTCVLVSQIGLQREIRVQMYRECSVAAASSNDDSQCSKLRHLCELSSRGNSSGSPVKLHLSAYLPAPTWELSCCSLMDELHRVPALCSAVKTVCESKCHEYVK